MWVTLLGACTIQTLEVGLEDTSPSTLTASTQDSGTEDTAAAPPEQDFSTWSGVRVLSDSGCDEQLIEVGERLDEDWVQYDLLREHCEDCEHWYVLDVSPATLCGQPVSTYTFRGLHLGTDEPAIYWMAEGALDGGHLADASWLGETLTYSAEFFGTDHLGTVTFGARSQTD